MTEREREELRQRMAEYNRKAGERFDDWWMFGSEKARALFGVPRKTKLRVVRAPKGKIELRWYLKSRGYILDERELIAYWTEDTRRAKILEKRPRQWYRFRPLEREI